MSISRTEDFAAHSRLKQRAAMASVATSVVLTVLKLAAGAASGSLALLSEGAHNGLDIAASGLTLFAVRAADKPADDEHPYGHAKIEAVAALIQTAFLAVLAFAVAFFAIDRLTRPDAAVEADAYAIGAIVISIVADLVRWRGLTRVAKIAGSHALAADALHFSSDLVSSILVFVGLAATRAGFPHADALAAIGVAVFIVVAGYRLGRETIDALVDRAPEGMSAALRDAVAETHGVASIDSVRLRPSGARVVGELVLSVSRTLPIERVAAIKSDVAATIAARWPSVELTVTANPRALDDETILERVILIAARRRLAVHHITVQDVEARKCVTLDLEVDRRMSLGEAHEIATGLEAAIADEIGADVEVDTHIEPSESSELRGQIADPVFVDRIVAALTQSAARSAGLWDIHDVRVRETTHGALVVFHCRVAPSVTVEAAHDAVDAVERSLRAAFPGIKRVVGHAEPASDAAAGR